MIYLQDRLLYTAFLDRDFCLINGAVENFKDSNKESSAPVSANLEKSLQNKVIYNSDFFFSVSLMDFFAFNNEINGVVIKLKRKNKILFY